MPSALPDQLVVVSMKGHQQWLLIRLRAGIPERFSCWCQVTPLIPVMSAILPFRRSAGHQFPQHPRADHPRLPGFICRLQCHDTPGPPGFSHGDFGRRGATGPGHCGGSARSRRAAG
jgi:hypothetical protein